MTTDTSKAPERIWAIPERNCTVYMSGNSPITAQDGPFTHRRHGTANEYVRRDLLDAMQAENERLREALTKISRWDWFEVEPHGADIPENVEPWARELDDACTEMQRTARAALERKEATP